VVLACWAVMGGLLVLQLLPAMPETPRQWVVLLVFGAPAWVLLEVGADRFFGPRRGASISPAPSAPQVSLRRILVGLGVALVVVALPVLWALRLAQ